MSDHSVTQGPLSDRKHFDWTTVRTLCVVPIECIIYGLIGRWKPVW